MVFNKKKSNRLNRNRPFAPPSQHGSEIEPHWNRTKSKAPEENIVSGMEQYYVTSFQTHREFKNKVVIPLLSVLKLELAYNTSEWLNMEKAIAEGHWPDKKGEHKPLDDDVKVHRLAQYKATVKLHKERFPNSWESEMQEAHLDGKWATGILIDNDSQSKNRTLADKYLRESCRGSTLHHVIDNYASIVLGDLQKMRTMFETYFAENPNIQATGLYDKIQAWKYTHGETPSLENWWEQRKIWVDELSGFDVKLYGGLQEMPVVETVLNQCELDGDLKSIVTGLRALSKYKSGKLTLAEVVEPLIKEKRRIMQIKFANVKKPNKKWGVLAHHNQPKAYKAEVQQRTKNLQLSAEAERYQCREYASGKGCTWKARCRYYHGNQIPREQMSGKERSQNLTSKKGVHDSTSLRHAGKDRGEIKTSQTSSSLTCYTCGGQGHVSSVCPNSLRDLDPIGTGYKKQKKYFKRALKERSKKEVVKLARAMKAALSDLPPETLRELEVSSANADSDSDYSDSAPLPGVRRIAIDGSRKKKVGFQQVSIFQKRHKLENRTHESLAMAAVIAHPPPQVKPKKTCSKTLVFDSGSSRTGVGDSRILSATRSEDAILLTANGKKKIDMCGDIVDARTQGNLSLSFSDAIFNSCLPDKEILVSMPELNLAGVAEISTSTTMFLLPEEDVKALLDIYTRRWKKKFLLTADRDTNTGMFTCQVDVPLVPPGSNPLSSFMAKIKGPTGVNSAECHMNKNASSTTSDTQLIHKRAKDTSTPSLSNTDDEPPELTDSDSDSDGDDGSSNNLAQSEVDWDRYKTGFAKLCASAPQGESNFRGVSLPAVFSKKQVVQICHEENARINQQRQADKKCDSAKLAKTYSNGEAYQLWHKRSCHIKGKGHHLPPGVKEPEGGGWCDGCVQGKMRAKSFHARSKEKKDETKYRVGEKWHADWKDFKVKSISGMTGRLLYVEQELGYWVSIFAKSSDEAVDAAEEIRQWVLRNTNATMRALHMDNGSYFTSTDMGEWAKQWNVTLSFSSKDCPQQNPFVERATQTLDDLVVANMAGDLGDFPKAPPRFWAEACKAIETVHNSLPEIPDGKGGYVSRAHILGAPEWQREDLRALFCEAWFYRIKDKRRGALAMKARPGVLVGYAQNRKAYRIWDLERHKIREIAIQHTVTYEDSYPFQNRDNWREEWLVDKNAPVMLGNEQEESDIEPLARNVDQDPQSDRLQLRRNPQPSAEGLESIASQAEN